MRAAFLLLALAVLGRAAAPETPLILVSLDGFRWDYFDKYAAESPNLRALRRDGVAARGLIPVFPSNTFPNHYTVVTGLYPANHGIVNNEFFDPAHGLVFRYNQPNSVRDSRWWGGEPIWATAIKQGRKAATAFWIGSEAEVAGVRPTIWQHYDYSIPFEKRLEELASWLRLPPPDRPAFVAFYLEETNGAGHRHGPDSPEVAAAVKLLDTRVGTMLARLKSAGIEPNIVIVSDHGMTPTSLERVVIIDDHVDIATIQVDSDGSVAALRPLNGDAAALVRAFEQVPHVKAYRADDLPARLRLKGSGRIAPVWILPDEGWHVALRSTFNRLRTRYAATGYLQGDHGYDPSIPSMRGIFLAHGPAFRRGVEIADVENVHVYNLLCAALKLKPAPNDGDDRLVKAALR